MKITDRQHELLEAMASDVTLFYMPYMGRFNPNPYYFRSDTHQLCTQAANRLRDLGLVEIKKRESLDRHQLVISKAGREYLKASATKSASTPEA